jgi:hemerythrin-like domain-containing protein
MTQAIESLRSDHQNMLRLLDVIEAEFNCFKSGGSPDYELLRSALRYCLHYPELYHHPKEDAIYAKLGEKVPQALTAIGDLAKAHEALSDLLRRIAAMVQRIEGEAEVPRPAATALMEEFVESYRQHISMEEEAFFPIAEGSLSQEDWQEIDAKIARIQDPLQETTAANYRALRQTVISWAAEMALSRQ